MKMLHVCRLGVHISIVIRYLMSIIDFEIQNKDMFAQQAQYKCEQIEIYILNVCSGGASMR